MELGKRLLQARLEAGLSQRQLCGEEITRNMLSQIEHGTARPSMTTLKYLAARLGKPVSFFLDDDSLSSPNQSVMTAAREAWDSGNLPGVLSALADFREPDRVFSREKQWLECLACLGLAETAVNEGRNPYALELLDRAASAGEKSGCFTPDLNRRHLLLRARANPREAEVVCRNLPSLDEELLLRADVAFRAGDLPRAAALLEAAGDHTAPAWNLLRGQIYLAAEDYPQAAQCLHRAENTFRETYPLLERCYREMEDYKMAYDYACRQKT